MENRKNAVNASDLSADRSVLSKATKNRKKFIAVLILSLVVISGLVFAGRGIKNETSPKPGPKKLTAAERKAELKKWEASPDGQKFKKWEASPEGKNVHFGAAKLREYIGAFTNMEAVITSLSLPPGSRLGFGVMVRINAVDYIVKFDPEKSQLEQLHRLKVNDKIIIRSHNVSYAPKYSYPIVSAEYVERDGRVIFKRVPRKGGC
ncbi:hypothetical protein [Pedobacter zeae]|uniref:Uncharacterized protein n=1 Tax=Pedobacter zeae TaxID=1737356 RepID=A0A7W6P534_9SPHI|nr:hypothetical protein [Pedobacter zeae]MBB4108199.1 hypothetical protein [Pedobacter zeae]GGG94388.1 hypothetical protein GCM10007422_04690 [Pedobacter zeae]